MSSTYLSLHYHIVFSTKERWPFIDDPWRPRMHEYLGGTVRGLEGIPEAVGGVADHVHLLVGLRATHRLSDFMQELKKASSGWARKQHECAFGWQDGYAAFSASHTHIEAIQNYIHDQETHHRKESFLDELVRLLQRNGVAYDPRYLA